MHEGPNDVCPMDVGRGPIGAYQVSGYQNISPCVLSVTMALRTTIHTLA